VLDILTTVTYLKHLITLLITHNIFTFYSTDELKQIVDRAVGQVSFTETSCVDN